MVSWWSLRALAGFLVVALPQTFGILDQHGEWETPGEITTSELMEDADTNRDDRLSLKELEALLQKEEHRESEDIDPERDAHGPEHFRLITEVLNSTFRASDTNGDNFLSRDELDGFNMAMDSNINKKRSASLARDADADRDGQLSLIELKVHMKREFTKKPNDTPQTRGAARAQFKAISRVIRPSFQKCDTNSDGFLSTEELIKFNDEMERRLSRILPPAVGHHQFQPID